MRYAVSLFVLVPLAFTGANGVPHAQATTLVRGTDPCAPEWVRTFGEAPGTGPYWILDLVDFDDGSGRALYVGGSFSTAGGVEASCLARWNGKRWSRLADELSPTSWGSFAVWALEVFDDGRGGGPALYAGGGFTTTGVEAANSIAKWDGTRWSPLGSGVEAGYFVRELAVFDDGRGGGPALHVGGTFRTISGVAASSIAKWDGRSWSPLGAGTDGQIHAMAVLDDGSGRGPALYVAGDFTTAGGVVVNDVARWDGTRWSALGSGLLAPVPSSFDRSQVDALAVFERSLHDLGRSGPEQRREVGWSELVVRRRRRPRHRTGHRPRIDGLRRWRRPRALRRR
jgi:hypothetical protein